MNNVDSYIESVDDDLKPIVIKLRVAIKGSSNDLREDIKWSVPTYSINKNICSIMAHKKHVNLQIFRGAEIEDSKILAGTGKGMRHLKYEKPGDVKIGIIKNNCQASYRPRRHLVHEFGAPKNCLRNPAVQQAGCKAAIDVSTILVAKDALDKHDILVYVVVF